MAERLVNTGFDPYFGQPAQKLIDQAKALGYTNAHLVSGVRSFEDQQQLYANMQAGRAGQPLPYPERGAVREAAVPGTSLHERGLASDVAGVPQDVLARLASRLGLETIAGDPGHIQLANWRQAMATQGPPTPWGTPPSRYAGPDVPASGAIPVSASTPSASGDYALPGGAAQPARPVSATPISGGTSHADFIRSYAQSIGLDPNLALGIANAEGLRAWSAKNPNAASTVDVQNGQPFSFGDFQLNIHPGAVGAQALAAKIDPRDPNQWQAADKFALDYMKAHGVGAWSGDPVAKQYLASGKVPALPAMPGTTLNSTPVAQGSPGVSSEARTSGGGVPPAGSLAGFTPGSPAEAQMQAAAKTLGWTGGGGGGDQTPQMAPLPQPQPPEAMGGQMMMGAGGQNLRPRQMAAQQYLQANMGHPLNPVVPSTVSSTAGSAPIASPGTTLNSPSALQYALMIGMINPMDLYSGQQAYYGSM